MPGIYIGNYINKVSSRSWTPLKPLGGETPDFWIQEDSRSGLTLTDSIAGNNATLTLPHVTTNGAGYASVSDNGGLDIGANDFTLVFKAKSNTTSKAARFDLVGKSVIGGVTGRYGFYVALTTGTIHFYLQSTLAVPDVDTGVVFNDQDLSSYAAVVNLATSKIHVYQNGVEIGAGTSFTGTFAAMANQFKFVLNAATDGSGNPGNNKSIAHFTDVSVYHSALTPAQLLSLHNGNQITGAAARYICNDLNFMDISGNGYKMTSGGTGTTVTYDSMGSRYLLDFGYSLYKFKGYNTARDLYLPYSVAGTPLVATVPTGYIKATVADDGDVGDHAGDLLNHNLADSKITFVGGQWKRDDNTIFNKGAIVAYTVNVKTHYNSGNVYEWHISELNKNMLNSLCVQTNYGRNWIKGDGSTTDNRVNIKEIFTYATNKTGADYIKANTYCGDLGKSYRLEYYFEPTDICTTRGQKILMFDPVAKLLKLSFDNGVTFPNTISTDGIFTLIQRAKIYSNGNILVCQDGKAYYSNNNLATLTASTVLDWEGNAYEPTNKDDFRPLTESRYLDLYGGEFDIWGCYSNIAGTVDVNTNVWLTRDSGVTIRSVYKPGNTLVGGVTIAARHIHSVNYLADTDEFIISTGDGDGKSNWIKGIFDNGTGTFTYSLLRANDEQWTKIIGMFLYDGYLYWLSDVPGGTFPYGIGKCAYDDIADYTKYNITHNTVQRNTIGSYDDGNGTIIGCEAYVSAGDPVCYHISVDRGKTWFRHDIVNSISFSSYGGIAMITPAKDDGYYKSEVMEAAESAGTNFTVEGGQTFYFKINKA